MDKKGVIHYKNWQASFIPHILKELYIDHVYAPYLYDKKNLTIIDAGLNIGLFSLFASQFAKQIYAFEPAKETFELAQLNIKDNNVKNVKLINKGIGIKNEDVEFYNLANTTASNTMKDFKSQATSTEKVSLIRLDTFVKQEKIDKIDFLKLDIEGTEDEVIGSDSFENIVPILDSFVVELHPWTKTNAQQIVTTIRDYGFRVKQMPTEATVLGCIKK